MAETRQGSFALSLQNFRNESIDKFGVIVRKVGLELARSVVMKSPVDTGRFRGNWNASLTMPKLTTTVVTDKDGNRTVQRANVALQLYDPLIGQDIWITNSLPYAIPLEWGHSDQAPAGVVRTTITEFQTYMKSAVSSAAGR